jgi:hypothetical protein
MATSEATAKLVGRWVGANPSMLHGWVLDDDGVLVVTVRVPLTPEEVAEYEAASRRGKTPTGRRV